MTATSTHNDINRKAAPNGITSNGRLIEDDNKTRVSSPVPTPSNPPTNPSRPFSNKSMNSTRSRCRPTDFITAISLRRSIVASATELAITTPPTTRPSKATNVGKARNWSSRTFTSRSMLRVSNTNTPGIADISRRKLLTFSAGSAAEKLISWGCKPASCKSGHSA